jgi:ATP-binding cassette, subfamily B, bacterial
MTRSTKTPRRTVAGWITLIRAFHAEIARERRFIWISAVAVLGGVVLRLLEPWPLKFIYNVLFINHKHGMSLALLQGLSAEAQMAIYTASMVVITGLAGTFEYISTVTMGVAASRILADIRANLFRHLANLSVSFHGRNRTGDLITHVTYDVDRMREVMVSSLLPFAVNVFTLTAMVGVMLWMNWKLGCIVAVVFPLFFLATDRLMGRIKDMAREQRRREGSVASATAETISSIRTVQALSLQSRFMEMFSVANRRSLQAGNKAQQLSAGLERVIDLIATSTTAVVLWYGARNVLHDQLTPGDLIVFTNYLRTGFKPIRQLAKYLGQIARALASGDRILNLLGTPLEIRDEPNSVAALPFQGHVVFENVSFEYEPQRRALRNVSFEVKPGQKVVLSGSSGSGKSTIASLLLRLHDPTEGRILIDGRDIRSYTLESLRSQISIVMQDSPLFVLSVRDNIALGAASGSFEEVIQAARIANGHDFIMQMPKQYDTMLGERGATLSGGQRQRVAIARAAIRKAPIIILDEPTTGLDRKNEQEVSAALNSLSRNSTTLLITHDLHAAQDADLVLFLSEGRIVESGTHESLVLLDREYAAMVHRRGLSDVDGEVACARF